jgi:hypothetical protein
MKRDIPDILALKVRLWLGEEGKQFFTRVKNEHGTFNAVWMDGAKSVHEGGIPHPVHLREGMQLRNFIHGQRLWNGL